MRTSGCIFAGRLGETYWGIPQGAVAAPADVGKRAQKHRADKGNA